MKKLKPFLIGTIAGCALMFVAMQFHLVRSEDGFRLVPRTPQPSVGLFYVDLRDWTPEDYADRPEVARALVAHGSTDLVASSVTNTLLDDVSRSGSTLEQLRGLINDDQPSSGLPIPDGLSSERVESAPESSGEFRDLLLPIFNQDARKPVSKQVTENDALKASRAKIAQQQFPAMDSGLGLQSQGSSPDITGRDEPLDPFRDAGSRPFVESPPREDSAFTASQESDLITEMLFGEDEVLDDSANSRGWQDSVGRTGDRIVGDIKNEVASRASQMADEFRGHLDRSKNQAFDQTLETLEDYSSRKLKESLPDSVNNFLSSGQPSPSSGRVEPANEKNDMTRLPPELKALQDGFDPFLK